MRLPNRLITHKTFRDVLYQTAGESPATLFQDTGGKR